MHDCQQDLETVCKPYQYEDNNCIVPVVSDWTVRWNSSQNERYG